MAALWRIQLPRCFWERRDPKQYNKEKLGKVFNISCIHVEAAVETLTGRDWLSLNPDALFSEVASRFLSNCMDLLLDSSILTALATAYVHPFLFTLTDLEAALDNYSFNSGDHPIGGFLDKLDLITNNNCAELLSTIRTGVISDDFDDTFNAINNITPKVNSKVLGDAIRRFVALHILYSHPNEP